MTNLTRGIPPVHPGAVLREDVLPACKLSKSETARRLGISRQTLYDILAEKQAITAHIALRLGRLFGNTPEFWMRFQQDYDLRLAERGMTAELEKIEPLAWQKD